MKKFIIIYCFLIIILSSKYCSSQWVRANISDSVWINCIEILNSKIFLGTDKGVYLSTDNGDTWSKMGINVHVYTMVTSENQIFAGTNQGVFLYKNHEQNWSNIGLNDNYVLSLAISGSNIFAGTRFYGIFLSTNNGQNWSEVNLGEDFEECNLCNITSLVISNSFVYAGCTDGLFVSYNFGKNWGFMGEISDSISKDRYLSDTLNLICTTIFKFIGDKDISLVISDFNIYAATLWGIFLSTNSGVNWTKIAPFSGRVLIKSGSNIYAGTYNGVYLCDNNWFYWEKIGLENITVLALAVSGTTLYAGTTDGLYVYKK